ncbi:MAG TPA: phosphatase PAP2 family protein, partial [Gemmataceae bacterium]|nr:phosphatase PAP2 family protein [Gemmataceae bacterium]
ERGEGRGARDEGKPGGGSGSSPRPSSLAPRPSPFIAWPGWRLLGVTVLLGTALSLWWLLVYGGAEWVTHQRTFRVRVHLDMELAMPYWPPAVVLYLSLFPLYWLAPFVLRERRQLVVFALTHAAVMTAAGVCFLLFPAELAYSESPHAGDWEELVQFARRMAMTYNLAPSLHVALAIVCVAVYAGRAPRAGKVLLWAWGGAIALSTLLIHEHHVLDVLTGWPLGIAGKRLIFDRLRATRPTARG